MNKEDYECAIKFLGEFLLLCDPPKEDRSKLFCRNPHTIGDYMGTGYTFLDAAERLFNEFLEKATDEVYRDVREYIENKEVIMRKYKI